MKSCDLNNPIGFFLWMTSQVGLIKKPWAIMWVLTLLDDGEVHVYAHVEPSVAGVLPMGYNMGPYLAG